MEGVVSRHSHMVLEYYVERLREERRKRAERIARLKSRADVLRRQKELRAKIREAFGPFPQKTPLNARVTGSVEQRRCTMHKVLFESRPGFLVSANLYVPKGLKGRAPAVLGVCGHSQEGKAGEGYQTFAATLALKGFVSMIIDPISQGERVQYPGKDGKPKLGLCPEHNMVGDQQELVGEFFGAWRAWDGIRAIDYLRSLPHVDPTRLGVTGNSGGGTMTTWLRGLDGRITMCAPGCFVTTYLSNLENELASDSEQIIPNVIKLGLDQADFFAAWAPAPVVLLTQAQDFFDQRGARQTFAELKRIYRLLGAERNVQIVTGPGGHGYSRDLREAMYGFFAKHAGLRVPSKEPKLVARKPEELFATKSGSVTRQGSKLVLNFTRAKADALRRRRGRVAPAKLKRILVELLALPVRSGPPHHRSLPNFRVGKVRVQHFPLETEPGIFACVTAVDAEGWHNPPPRGERCVLVVPHMQARDVASSTSLRAWQQGGRRVFAVDPRGFGETRQVVGAGGDLLAGFGPDYLLESHALMLGEPYIGRRVHDVLSTLDWLESLGYREIDLVGVGLGATLALLAASVDDRPASVTLVNSLLSYHELIQVHIYKWPVAFQVRGALERFDLPDCYRAIAKAKKLTLIKPWDGQLKVLKRADGRARVKAMGILPRVLKG
jgi:cephalosporin-C deacetylase-like acetyl esterase